jgi:hypothetical protein
MTDQEYRDYCAAQDHKWACQRRWRAQGDALAALAEQAYDDEDWAVGDALQARADDLLSLVDD